MPYEDNSDADDEYERSVIASPGLQPEFERPSTKNGEQSSENTPRTYTHAINGEPSPTGSITQWTPEQCSDYVTSLGLEQYATGMIGKAPVARLQETADLEPDQEIDGQALIAMHHEEFKDLGIRSVGHRLTILKAVYDMKLRHNVQIDNDHYVPLCKSPRDEA